MKKIIAYIAFLLPLSAFTQTFTGRVGDFFETSNDSKNSVESISEDDEEHTSSTLNKVNLTNAERRLFRLGIVNLLEEYELRLPGETSEDKYKLKELFENDDVIIYNDLLGLSNENELRFEEYCDLWYNEMSSSDVIIKNINIGDIYENETHVLVDATFDKEVSYITNCGITFDSKNFYKTDHNLKATIVMDKSSGRISFRRIKGSINSDATPLPQHYKVFICNSNEPRDKKVTANKQPLSYDNYSQAFVDANAKIEYKDPDVALKLIELNDCDNLYSFKFRNRRWRIKPKAEIAVGNKKYHFAKDGSYFDDRNDSDIMAEAGLDFGFAVVALPKFKLSLFTGAGFSKSIVNFKQSNYDYISFHYNAGPNADYDGDSYTRHYEVKNLKAKMELSQVYVPLYLDFDFILSKNFSIYLQGGAKAYYNLDFKITDIEADLYTYGVYPQYGNLKMENFEPNKFGNYSYAMEEQEVIGGEKYNIDVFGGLGFRWKLFGTLYLDAGVTYQMNVTPIYESEYEHIFISFSASTRESDSLFTYTCNGGEKIASLYRNFEDVTRKVIKPTIGFIVKF